MDQVRGRLGQERGAGARGWTGQGGSAIVNNAAVSTEGGQVSLKDPAFNSFG